MKRSEAVDIIEKEITSSYGYKVDSRVTAHFILKYLEEAGMLPPIVSVPERCMCGMRSSCQDCSPDLYKTNWDEED